MRMRHTTPAAHIATFAPVSVRYMHSLVQLDVCSTGKSRILGHPEGLCLLLAVDLDALAVG